MAGYRVWGIPTNNRMIGDNEMTKREETYIDNLHKKFSVLLDNFMKSDIVDWDEKEPILDDFKFMIDERIRELHSEDLLA